MRPDEKLLDAIQRARKRKDDPYADDIGFDERLSATIQKSHDLTAARQRAYELEESGKRIAEEDIARGPKNLLEGFGDRVREAARGLQKAGGTLNYAHPDVSPSSGKLERHPDGTITAKSIQEEIISRRGRGVAKYSKASTSNVDPNTGEKYTIGFDGKRRHQAGSAGFDPEGDGFDYGTANDAGSKPGSDGHWGSLDPRTGMVLKGRGHPTWDLMEAEETKRGSRIVKRGGRYYSEPARGSNSLASAGAQARSMSASEIVDLNNRLAEIDKQFPGITKDKYTARDLMLKSRGPYRQHFRDPITGMPRLVTHPNDPFEALARLNQAASARAEARNLAIQGFRDDEIKDRGTNAAIDRMFPGIDRSSLEGLDPADRMRAAQYLYEEEQEKKGLERAREELEKRKAHAKATLPSWVYSAIEPITDPDRFGQAFDDATKQVADTEKRNRDEHNVAIDASAAEAAEYDSVKYSGADETAEFDEAIQANVKALSTVRPGSPAAAARSAEIKRLQAARSDLHKANQVAEKDAARDRSARVVQITDRIRDSLKGLRDATLTIPKKTGDEDFELTMMKDAAAKISGGGGATDSVEYIDKKVALIRAALRDNRTAVMQLVGEDVMEPFREIIGKFESGSRSIVDGKWKEKEWARAKGDKAAFDKIEADLKASGGVLEGLFTEEGLGAAGSVAAKNPGQRLFISSALDRIASELQEHLEGLLMGVEMADSGSTGPMFSMKK